MIPIERGAKNASRWRTGMAVSKLRRYPERAISGDACLNGEPHIFVRFAPSELDGLPDRDVADPGFGSDPAPFDPDCSTGNEPARPWFPVRREG
jgi:hypothetical protein